MATPAEAYALCESDDEADAVARLWRHADRLRHRPFDASSRFLQGRWGLSARRTERLLARLVEAGLVRVVEEGTNRDPRRIECWNPTWEEAEEAERRPERRPERKNSPREPVEAPDRNADRNADRNEYVILHTTDSKDTPPKPPSRGAGPWEGLTGRQRNALASAGVSSLDVAAAMTRSELKARPGIGKGTVRAVEAVLAGAGMRLRPEPEAPARADDAVLQAAGSVFGKAYVQHWCGVDPDSEEARDHRYPWQWRQRDRSHVRSWCEALGLSAAGGDMSRLRASVEAYMADCKAGTAFPKGEPPTVGQFTRQLAKYAAARPTHATPTATADPRQAGHEAWADVLRRGRLIADRPPAIRDNQPDRWELADSPEERARRRRAVQAAGGWVALCRQSANDAKWAFVRAYEDEMRRAA